MHATILRTILAFSVLAVSTIRAAELAISSDTLTIATETAHVTGCFATGEVDLKAGKLNLAGKGTLLAVRPAGFASRLLEGGADRRVGDGDVLAVQLRTRPGPALVALVNLSSAPTTARVSLRALGLTTPACASYDFSSGAFVGPLARTVVRPLAGNEVVLLGVAETADRPVVLASTADTKAAWDAAAQTLSGRAEVRAGETYLLRILAPPLPTSWSAKSVAVRGGKATHAQEGACVRVDVQKADGDVTWEIAFARGKSGVPRPATARLTATPASHRCITLSSTRHGPGMVLRRNDGREIAMDEASLSDTTVVPDQSYTYTLHEATWDGRLRDIAKTTVKTPARPAPPPLPNVYLSDLKPIKAINGWNGDPRRDKSIEDNAIRIRGETFERGMGVHAHSELVYAAKPEFKRFVAVVGIDDETGAAGSIRFSVLADDRTLLKTPVLTGNDEPFSINVVLPAGTEQVRLIVDDGGNGIGSDHGDWANAGFVTRE